MKKWYYFFLGVIILVLSIIIVPSILDRVKNSKIVENNRSTKAKPLSYISINGEAKKVPSFLMTNQDSLLISNEDFYNKVYIVEFFFTRCPSICPIMNKNMKRLETAFGERADFGIASFTIDPENDTPNILKKYANLYEVFSKNWHFLTSTKEAVFDLSNNGFNIFSSINPEVAGGFEHQGYFALIDKQGFIRSRLDPYGNPIVYYLGIDQEDSNIQEGTEMLIEDIPLLLNE
ncbi:MAG: SCO family protein [Flavobacteriaceae bacterium]|nr:SCO family protein [Flavobacteriaceae bacterium]|tara:strand:+ start:21422 stop:22120 length:699 start_codon:yes stop_codon:yes gene_type:complete